MSVRASDLISAVLGLVSMVAVPATALAAPPDWKAVEQALGKSGQLQTGDVFRVGVEGGVVTFRKNGTAFFQSKPAPTYPLFLAATLGSLGTHVNGAVISGTLGTH